MSARSRLIKLVVVASALVMLLVFHTNAMAATSGYLAVVSLRDAHKPDVRAEEPWRGAEAPGAATDASTSAGSSGFEKTRTSADLASTSSSSLHATGAAAEKKQRLRSDWRAHTDAAEREANVVHGKAPVLGGGGSARADAPAEVSEPTDCPAGRRPYHVVMTAASGLYQEWQSRIAYYHYQKQKRLNPCSDLGSFTRLFNTQGAQPDSLMDEIPTYLVKQLGHGHCDECDHGFIVMNRPWGVVQLVESEYWRTRIGEEYVLIMETDHMIMQPPKNEATEERPVGFGFYYMTGTDPKLQPVVEKFLAPGIPASTVDAVGPSPLIVHKPMLKRLARPWWDLSMKMKEDDDANRVFGWVLEMWGYNIAARNMGIRHTVSKDIQVEPQGVGTDDMDGKAIYHYTFGLTVGPWHLEKRGYYGRYPSDHTPDPPMCSARSGFIMARLWSEAAQSIPGWQNRDPSAIKTLDASTSPLGLLLKREPEQPGLAELLRGTGPWNFGKVSGLFLFSRGVAYISKQERGELVKVKGGITGSWRVAPGQTSEAELQLCGMRFVLHFEDAANPWTFTASILDSKAEPVKGVLPASEQQRQEMLPHSAQLRLAYLGSGLASRSATDAGGNATFAEELAGSGPWSWAGIAPFGFMRGGHLVTPWGTGTWGVTRRAGAETASADSVFADFANSEHTVRVTNLDCLRLTSTRKADGDKVGLEFVGTPSAEADKCHKALLQAL